MTMFCVTVYKSMRLGVPLHPCAVLPLACWKDFVPARVPFICAQETNTISPALLNKEIILEPLQLDVGNKLNKFHISSVVIAYLGHELADSMAAWLPTRGFFCNLGSKLF